MKRIQNLLGGELFRKTPHGTAPTSLGKLVLNQARRMLDANDQMLRLGGTAEGPQPLRFGISTLFVKEFLEHETAETLTGVVMYTDHSLSIAKGLIDGYVDVGCILENSEAAAEVSDLIVNERDEPFAWVRSKNFVLSPGAPIPLLTWPGDDMMVRLQYEPHRVQDQRIIVDDENPLRGEGRRQHVHDCIQQSRLSCHGHGAGNRDWIGRSAPPVNPVASRRSEGVLSTRASTGQNVAVRATGA